MPKGGHFAALEQSELFANDLRMFFPVTAVGLVARALRGPWQG